MSKFNYQPKIEGHRFEGSAGRGDLDQKLTYQQLLNLNHDLTKENQQLKNIGNRLGSQLKNLHSQFQIRPREENVELYHAIGNHPILHQYELTLLPLLDAYEAKIQEFQSGFETINEEFINLEKQYEKVATENQKLKRQMGDKIKEMIEVYQTGHSEKLGTDFNQIILQQVSEKHKILIDQNYRIQREYQKYKSEAERAIKDLEQFKKKDHENRTKISQFQLNHKQFQSEVKNLKQNIFNLQLKNNELQSEKKKIRNDLDRASSQVNQLNRDKDSVQKNYEDFKGRYERNVSLSYETDQTRVIEQLKSKLMILENKDDYHDDSHKKLTKIQKEYEFLLKEKIKLNEKIEEQNIKLEDSREAIDEFKRKIQDLDIEKNTIEISESKLKKSYESLEQKCKKDIVRLKKDNEAQNERLEDQFNRKIDIKSKKLSELEQEVDKIKLERDKLEKQNIIHSALSKDGSKQNKSKESQKTVQKLKQKLSLNDQIYKEHFQMLENDNSYLKRETEGCKLQAKEKSDDARKARQELEKTKKQLCQVLEQKSILIQEIRRVKYEYEGNLKDKQKLFDQKIREIKTVVQESDKRRKSQRDRVSQASREYKRVLQEIKSTYEERIRMLQGQNTNLDSKVRKFQNYA